MITSSSESTKIYLGGTFNPVHVGHARLLLECQGVVGASKAYFVPSAEPPHKPAPMIKPSQRLIMAQMVADELNGIAHKSNVFGVEACELERSGPSFTIDTLEYLREKSKNDRILWVMGMDSLVNIATWRKWQELLGWANLLVVNRPGWELPTSGAVAEWIKDKKCSVGSLPLAGGVAVIETTGLAVSSSHIRKQLKLGLPLNYLLPEPILAYIKQNELYY